MKMITAVTQQLLRMQAHFALSLLIGLFVLSSCDSPPTASEEQQQKTVNQTLNNLGVSTEITPRLASDGDPLPEAYAPLGASLEPQKFEELLLLGWSVSGSTGHNSLLNLLTIDRKNDQTFDTTSLFAPDKSLTSWAEAQGEDTTTLRVSVGADVDNDGLEELIIVHQDGADANIELQVYDDQVNNFANTQSLIISTLDVTHLSANAADLNGDGYDELVIGLVTGRTLQIWIIENHLGSLQLSAEATELPAAYADSEISSVIETGNIDYDFFAEFVVVMNEHFYLSGETGASQYFIFDDLENNLTEISRGKVHAESINRTAIVADVSLGDIDGDNLDEIVFGGLTHFDPTMSCEYSTVVYALDDVEAELVSMGATEEESTIHNGCASPEGQLRFVHVNTGDLDGDSIAEIQANEFIFEDFNQHSPFTLLFDSKFEVAELPQTSLYASSGGFTGLFSAIDSDIVMADVTANERQEVIIFSQSTQRMEIWGLGEPVPDQDFIDKQWRRLHSVDIDPTSDDTPRWPMLTTLNVNHDGIAISYDDGGYQLVFSSPEILAVIAASPCFTDPAMGQNQFTCRTTSGTSDSESDVNTTEDYTEVGVGYGYSFGDEQLAKLEVSLDVYGIFAQSHSSVYSYSTNIQYTTGLVEDSVYLTTTPFDTYTYTVSSHPDPEMIGEPLVIAMPRESITVQVEREFYNESVGQKGPLIDESVFQHTTGQPHTYLSAAEKDALINRYKGENKNDRNQWAYAVGPQTVGQGGGFTSQAIHVGTEFIDSDTFGLGYKVEFEHWIFGGKGSLSVLAEITTTTEIVHGVESEYIGRVSNLSADAFAENYYSWGVLAYRMDDHESGQAFEVINYWVE